MSDPKTDTIIRELQSWLDWNERANDGAVTDETHIYAPPVWPSRGMIKNWIAHLRSVQPIAWRPINEYHSGVYAGYDEMVLVGWYGSGMHLTGEVFAYGVGYLVDKVWHDRSDHKPWPNQPTYFACVCDHISKVRESKDDD